MVAIKQGYGGGQVEIRINPGAHSDAELWIEQVGHPKYSENAAGEIRLVGHSETLSYMTLQEVIALRDELNSTIKEMTGI
jgi:hypothetical protein